MNRLIDNLFEKKIVVRIISVLTALLLWFIVLDNVNPIEVKTFTVPLSSNVEVLEENNLRIVGAQPPTSIDVTIKGRRSKISDITVADFSAELDLESVKSSGNIEIPIPFPQYTGKKNILMTSMNPEKATLKLERITGVEFPVEITWAEQLPEGYQIVNLTMVPDTIVLEDKESLISRASRVAVTINPYTEKTNITKRISVYTDKGEVISQFEGKTPVSISYDIARTVVVSTGFKGTPAEDWFVSAYSIEPSSVQVIGAFEKLKKLTVLQTSSIDVEQKAASFSANLEIVIPEGLKLYKTNPAIVAKVELEKLETITVTIPSSLVAITGVIDPTLLKWTILDTELRLALKGKPQDLAGFKSNAATFTIDVQQLAAGEHLVPVSITLPPSLRLIGQNSLTVVGEPIPQTETTETTTKETVP